jgi:hypothetical protein
VRLTCVGRLFRFAVPPFRLSCLTACITSGLCSELVCVSCLARWNVFGFESALERLAASLLSIHIITSCNVIVKGQMAFLGAISSGCKKLVVML